MLVPDVNVPIYAHRIDVSDHKRHLAWLEGMINDDAAYGMVDMVLSSFIRIVTHPRVFSPPSALDDALAFVDALRSRPNCVTVAPGPRHWALFVSLCRRAARRATWYPMPISPHWQLNRAVNGSRRTAHSPVSRLPLAPPARLRTQNIHRRTITLLSRAKNLKPVDNFAHLRRWMDSVTREGGVPSLRPSHRLTVEIIGRPDVQ